MSSAKEFESSRNTKMPLWPVKVGVNGCVPSKDTLLHCFCDPALLPSYFPSALLTFIAPQLNRMTRQSCIYCEFSCYFFFFSTRVLQVSGQCRKIERLLSEWQPC